MCSGNTCLMEVLPYYKGAGGCWQFPLTPEISAYLCRDFQRQSPHNSQSFPILLCNSSFLLSLIPFSKNSFPLIWAFLITID